MTRLSILAVAALALVACGPGAKIGNGKQGAAEALMAASGPTKAGSDKAGTPVDLTGAVTWTCPKGGSAKLSGFSLNVNTTGGANVSQSFKLEYLSCGLADSDQGVAIYNGSMTVNQTIVTSATGVDLEQKFVGHVLVQGAFDDFIDADVTQKVSAGVLNGTGQVSATLIGSITTSSGAYSYNEAVSVTGGRLSATLPPKK